MICSSLMHVLLEQRKNKLGYEDFYQYYVTIDKAIEDKKAEMDKLGDAEVIEYARKFFDDEQEKYRENPDCGEIACRGQGCVWCCHQPVSVLLCEEKIQTTESGWCEKLDRENGVCTVYAQRPLVCRKHAVVGMRCSSTKLEEFSNLALVSCEILLSAILRLHVVRHGQLK